MDLTLAAYAVMTLATARPDARPVDPPTGPFISAPRIAAAPRIAVAPGDTIIEYDRAYYTRLTIHRWASYTILPLFAAQYYLGDQLYSGNDENKDLHVGVAMGVAGLFAVNTTTGLMNLWAMRADPNNRTRRIAHVTLMLLADAGFVTTGLLADDAESGGGGGSSTHRAVAISSMAVSTIGWLIQTDLFGKKD